MAALQVAKRLGVRTIATTRTRAKFRTLIDAGFDHVVVTDEQKVPEYILRATEGAGADLVYDAVAGPGLEDLANATKVMGHLVVYGALGAMTAATPLPLWAIFRRTVRMYAGYKVFDFMGNRNMGMSGHARRGGSRHTGNHGSFRECIRFSARKVALDREPLISRFCATCLVRMQRQRELFPRLT
jgi:hypothetical protein